MTDPRDFDMHGTITHWDGHFGTILTDDGEKVELSRLWLTISGITVPPKVGDRICFAATKRVDISYHLSSIDTIVPTETTNDELRRLRLLHRAIQKQRNPDDFLDCEDFTGTLESYDPSKGYGFVRADSGEKVLLHATCLRAAGYRKAEVGSRLSFGALQRRSGWQVYQILTLREPAPQ